MTRRDITHVLFAGVVVQVIGRHVRLTIDGRDKVLTLEDAARLGKVLVSLGEGE